MLQSSSYLCAKRLLSGLAAALILSIFASGCADRDGSEDRALSRAAAQPTSMDLYVKNCAVCHGVDGSGNGPLAAELKVSPSNLRLLKQSNDGRFPSSDVQRYIDGRATARAHGLPDMPVWSYQWVQEGLNDAEMKARAISIASYIASIQD